MLFYSASIGWYRTQKEKHAGSGNKLFPTLIPEKKATLVLSIVKLLYRQTKKAQSERPRVPEGEKKQDTNNPFRIHAGSVYTICICLKFVSV